MQLIQLLLPVYDNKGRAFPAGHYQRVRQKLADMFNGLTAFTRAPAEGLWKDDGNAMTRDDIVIFEVMVEGVDEAWWRDYKVMLETLFSQDEIIIRVQDIRLI